MLDWTADVRQNLRLHGFEPAREAEIIEEVARQLEDAYTDALQAGASEPQAAEAARRHISDWAALARELEESHRGRESAMTLWQQKAEDRDLRKRGRFSMITDLRQDVLYGLRVLTKSPGLTIVAALTLALCIGANTAIFTVINAVMLKSLPVRDPQHLMLLHWSARVRPKIRSSSSYGDCESTFRPINASGCSFSRPFLDDVRKLGLFSAIAEFAGAGPVTVSGRNAAHQANGQFVSGGYFQTLGVGAAIGRTLMPADDAPGAPAAVVLHYGYWMREFGGDRSIIGQTLRLNRMPFTIVGVAAERFAYLTPGTVRDLSIPISLRRRLHPEWSKEEGADSWWIVAVGRLKQGITPQAAQARVNALFVNDLLHGDKPLSKAGDRPEIRLIPAQTGLTGMRERTAPLLYVLMLAVLIVLLIGCANVAGLLLARANKRQREIAVRQALGANRARLVRQLLTESITLSLLGGALGVLLAHWGVQALFSLVTRNSHHDVGMTADLDLRVLGFTFAAAILTGVLFGIAPALRSMRVDLTPALKSGPEGAHAPQSRLRPGDLLVVLQVALTVVVLVGAGLLVHTLSNLRKLDPGFATQNLLTFSVDPTLTGFKDERLEQFYLQLQQGFSAIPGVLTVSHSGAPLLAGDLWGTDFHLPGTPPKSAAYADYMPIGPGFFETVKIPVIKGRDFKPEEYELAGKVNADKKAKAQLVVPAIVNEAFLRAYFPKGDPLGRPFGANSPGMSGDPEDPATAGWKIVGVARDAMYSELRREIHPTMYVPSGGQAGTFELRTARDPMSVMPEVREVVRKAGNDIPIVDVRPQAERIDEMLFQERLIARLSSLFGLLALLLACIGLYGLLAYEVTRGTREIGIRMALGAPSGDVLRRVMRHGVALTAVGAIIGVGASLAVTRFLGSLLYDVKPGDPLTLVAVSVLLIAVSLAACYIPGRRATHVDPLVALRHE
ncbi:MAG TPA: ABC transporter permease [Bryobacteraceae bacterium]|nr:ABC transporter permease [Bryobacteraceae bacterium]